MADIRPFPALIYDTTVAGDIATLVAPPYDKIDAALADQLHEHSPFNFVRLGLGHGSLDPADPGGRYQTSARTLAQWREQGVMKRCERPVLFAWQQSYELGGVSRTRIALVAAGGLARFDEQVVLPHERTMSGPRQDRLELMRATRTNSGQIFMLEDDPERVVDGLLQEAIATQSAAGSSPTFELVDYQGVTNRYWALEDPSLHEKIRNHFRDRKLFIADGHHRYETGIAYRDEVVTDGTSPDHPARYGQWAIVNAQDPGLHVYATHRVIHGVTPPDPDRMRELLEASFDVEDVETDPITASADLSPGVILLVIARQEGALRLRLSDAGRETLNRVLASPARASMQLDVDALHELVIDGIYGIDRAAQVAKTNLRYRRDPCAALTELTSSEVCAVALLAPTPVQGVLDCARAGEVMPQKSTDFFPKMLGGLSVLDLAEDATL